MSDTYADFKDQLPGFVRNESDFEKFKINHTAEHIFNQAIEELWPNKITRALGPAIKEGFYNDSRWEMKVSESDFSKIENKMREIVAADLPLTKISVTIAEAKELFANNPFKQELLNDFAKTDSEVTIYKTGDQFTDLCKGPHVDSTGAVSAFKLLKIAGAYWRGDENNEMLTRIYGIALASQKELDEYLENLEQAKLRDHKLIGKKLNLFTFSDIVGPGLPMLTPNGQTIRAEIEKYLVQLKIAYGHKFVWTPHLAKSDLYMKSKHWQKYDAMMPPVVIDDQEYTMKPMNCPHHFEIFSSQQHSYRDLPLRYAENATVYRFEKSGEINGLLRVRSLTQDDSHWFVPHSLLEQEINHAIKLMKEIFDTFGLKKFRATISSRDPQEQDKYLGDKEVWDKAEAELEKACKANNIDFEVAEGDAAFYGPKIDIMFEDSLKREWQLTTIQLDFNQPENFDLHFINKEGEKERLAVLHIAILGSVERFMGIIIEEYAGKFPIWLAPEQVRIIPISDQNLDYAQRISQLLTDANIRHTIDEESERMQNKIRKAQEMQVPVMFIIGKREEELEEVSVRFRTEEEFRGQKLTESIKKLKLNIEANNLDINFLDGQ